MSRFILAAPGQVAAIRRNVFAVASSVARAARSIFAFMEMDAVQKRCFFAVVLAISAGLCICGPVSAQQPQAGSAYDLFVANATCTNSTGGVNPCPEGIHTDQAVPPVGLANGVATLSPTTAFFTGTTATFGGTTYGGAPRYGGGNGGPAGWIHVSFAGGNVPAGSYQLSFRASHVGDTAYASALAIDNVSIPRAETVEGFESGIPSAWTFSGPATLDGVAGSGSGITPTVTPTGNLQFAWIATGCAPPVCPTVATTASGYDTLYAGPGTNGLPSGQGLGSPTRETILKSPVFTVGANDTISFDVNYVTTDGTYGFADFAAVQLVPVAVTPVISDGTGTTPTRVIFNSTTDQLVEHDLIFPAHPVLPLPITNPQLKVTNRLISNGTGWPPYVAGTPFAISQLFVHNGDNKTGGGTDIGSMYSDECFNDTNPPSDNNCPYPIPGEHIISKDTFDISTKPTIAFGTTPSFVHYYSNTITGITQWTPSSSSPNPVCTNVTVPGFACDALDIMVSMGGDQTTILGRDGKKGTFVSVYNVPMLLSAVKVNDLTVNTPGMQGGAPVYVHSPLKFDFTVSPAQLPANFTGNLNNWVAAPVSDLFYTFNPVSSNPPALPDIPDMPTCPGTTPGPTGSICTVTSGTPGVSSTANVKFTSDNVNHTSSGAAITDGSYFLQWSAEDTVHIRERNVQRISEASTCPDGTSVPSGGGYCYTTSLFSAQINVDNTPPTITITTPANNATYVLGQNVAANYVCTDALSGVASCTGPVANGSNINTTSVGSKALTVNSADKAIPPNASSATVNYNVVSYSALVQQPINPDGSSVFNARRGVIPVKFTLTLNGGATCALPGAMIGLTRTAGGVLGAVDENLYEMAADNGSNFRISGCQYIYNLGASSIGVGTYRVDVLINGIVVGNAIFALK